MSFDEFWAEYPRKVSKGAARTAYAKALKAENHETVMAGLEAFNEYLEKHPTERQYIKHASTWLNQECWEDEHVPKDSPGDEMKFDRQRRDFKAKYDSDPEFWGKATGLLKLYEIGPYAKEQRNVR